GDGLRDDAADALGGGQLVDGGAEDVVEAAPLRRQRLGDRGPDVADVEPDQEAGERLLLGRLDGVAEVLDGGLAPAVERAEHVPVDGVDVGDVLHQAEVHELADPLLAQAFDVERAAAGEVVDAAGGPGRAGDVHAAGF